MEQTSGKSYSPDRFDPNPPKPPEAPKPAQPPTDYMKHVEQCGYSFLVTVLAGLLMLLIGTVTAISLFILLAPMKNAKVLQYKIRLIDKIGFAILYAAVVAIVLHYFPQHAWGSTIGVALGVLVNTAVLAACGFYWVSRKGILQPVARLLVLCVVAPIAHSGIIAICLLNAFFQITTQTRHSYPSYNQPADDTTFGTMMALYAVGALVVCAVVANVLELTDRKKRPPEPEPDAELDEFSAEAPEPPASAA